ncbi:hypothetical protein M3Y99_01775400 [Aphelenchoides fujianensis]|nr:hypothetical protein M3Y99_01775400 [Aphelenchoides fujianensis]
MTERKPPLDRPKVDCAQPGDPCSFAPHVHGMGDRRLQRWTFNRQTRRCEQFVYFGLKGNQNSFVSHDECAAKCMAAHKPEIAALVPASHERPNPCRRGSPLVDSAGEWRRCREHEPCPRSSYCHIGEEQAVCCPTEGTDPCGQPLESGTGGAKLQRWYWNQQSQCCAPFNYCGLKGTQNNFLNRHAVILLDSLNQRLEFRQDCERTCLEFENPCAGGTPELGADFKPKQCGMFNACSADRWCHLGSSSATTVCCPESRARRADLPAADGVRPGAAALQRWYFDSRAACCRPFVYRGRLGNQNSFLSQQDCQTACVGKTEVVNVCPFGVPLVDEKSGKPLGCTYETEEEVCGDRAFCHLGLVPDETQCCPGEPRSIAACAGRALLDTGVGGGETKPAERWMFDVNTQSCLNFTFNGRKGNPNNFLSEEDCLEKCKGLLIEAIAVNPCKLPVPLPLQQCVPGPGQCGNNPQLYCHVGAVPQTTVCCPLEGDPCRLPLDPGKSFRVLFRSLLRFAGVGDARLERFFYNAEINSCQPFLYAGLKGNANNYLTQLQCEDQCVPNPCAEGRPFVGADGRQQTCSASASMNSCPTDYWCHIGAVQQTTVCCPGASRNPCSLPMSTGEGGAQLERFFFDQASKTCKPFLYQGEPERKPEQLPDGPLNPCIGQPATTPSGQVLFCSATNRDVCPVNFWCHLGANPETTVCCPGATNPCSVPLAPGTGNAGLSRWYYNADERQCVQFQYNGKRGNQNAFLSQAPQLCLLSIDRGACSGRQTRYAFNRQTNQCTSFEYSGCGGNLNNFNSMTECQETCGNVQF